MTGSSERPPMSRSGSLEIKAGGGRTERGRSREMSLSFGLGKKTEPVPSQEADTPLDSESNRPRSPKPEADGKLDR